MNAPIRVWDSLQRNRNERLARASGTLGADLAGKALPAARIADLLHAVLEHGDRVCIEGNNQKQADFLAQALAGLDPQRVHGLHMLQSVLALPEHLDVFERGIASQLDFSFSGPQATRVARLAAAGKLNIGAIHTYLELFSRYFIDLPPRVALVAAEAAAGR
jgi:malonate decarboxylase alpha subunit